jgi:hypothetical protein
MGIKKENPIISVKIIGSREVWRASNDGSYNWVYTIKIGS